MSDTLKMRNQFVAGFKTEPLEPQGLAQTTKTSPTTQK